MIKLFIFIFSFISTLGMSYVYYKFSDCKKKISWQALIFFFLGVIAFMLVKYFELNFISLFLYFLFYPFLFYLINPIKLKKLIYYLIIIWIIGMTLDLVVMILVSFVHYLFDIEVYGHFFEMLPTFLVFCCMVIIGHSAVIKKHLNRLYSAFEKINYLDFMIFVFIIFMLILGIALSININNLDDSLLIIILVLFSLWHFVVIVKVKLNKVENDIFLTTLKDNNDFYVNMIDEYRIFKHNLIARLLSIKSVSNKKATLLINDLIRDFSNNTEFLVNIKEFPYGLNGILYQKLYPYFNTLHIKIDNNLNYDIFDLLNPRKYNVFVEKVVISLDNAIEASLKSKNKDLLIAIYDDKNYISLEIKNSFDTDINLDVIGTKHGSSKNKYRGLGLFSALRNKEAIVQYKIVNNLFEAKILVKKFSK